VPRIIQWVCILLLRHINNLLGFIARLLKPKGVLFMPKSIQFTCTTPFQVSHKTLGSITYLLEFGRVLHSLNKT